MTGQAQQEVTQLLQAWRGGERAALDRLVPLVQGEWQLAGRSPLDKVTVARGYKRWRVSMAGY
jgi:hypothetical protein